MTGTPGRAVMENEIRVCSAEVRSSLDLPASIGTLAELSAKQLEWRGSVLPPVKLLGRHVVPVAELISDAHAERLCFGSAPVLDRTEIATWVWPEMEGRVPPSATNLVGMLAPARHWRSALTAAVPFARFTSTAIVIPRSVTEGADFVSTCLIRARQFGIAVLSAEGEDVRVELAGRAFADAPPAEPTAISRWVDEVVYEQLLEMEVPAPTVW
ncbi:hypothetical protein [Parasphingorhabdus pacifica]